MACGWGRIATRLACALWLAVCGPLVGYAQDDDATDDTPVFPNAPPEPAAEQPPPIPARERLALHFVDEGRAAFNREEYRTARLLFERAVEAAPLRAEGYYFLGRANLALGRPDRALAFLHKAELLFPAENPEWLGKTTCLQGAIHEEAGDHPRARASYRRCLEFSPDNLRAVSALARLPGEEPAEDLP